MFCAKVFLAFAAQYNHGVAAVESTPFAEKVEKDVDVAADAGLSEAETDVPADTESAGVSEAETDKEECKEDDEPESADVAPEDEYSKGDIVRINGLAKKGKKYNELAAEIVAYREDIQKWEVEFVFKNKIKSIKVSADNLSEISDEDEIEKFEKSKTGAATRAANKKKSGGGIGDMFGPEMLSSLMSDPDIMELMSGPHAGKVMKAMQEVQSNPMSAMKYMSDPDLKPIINKLMEKFTQGDGLANLMKNMDMGKMMENLGPMMKGMEGMDMGKMMEGLGGMGEDL